MPLDAKTVYPLSISRFLRSFVFTILAVSSPFFLKSLGMNPLYSGLILALSGVSSTAFVYVFPGLKISMRKILLILWVLFFLSLAILLIRESLATFIIALLVGGIPLSGKDMSPNQALEQYSVGKSATDQRSRNTSYGFYNFLSYAGSTLAALILFLFSGMSFLQIFQLSFVFAIVSGIPYMIVPLPEYTGKIGHGEISKETRKLRNELISLFAVDSFAGGLVNASMLSLWFLTVYSTNLGETGFIFVVVNILSAMSVLISGRISSTLGMVRTMVYTHLISNAFLILMAVVHSLIFSESMLFLRQATSQMDVPPRDSFINTIIPEDERISTNSQFIAARNVSIIPAPAMGGAMFSIFQSGIPMVAGGLKAAYDLVFFARFKQYKQ